MREIRKTAIDRIKKLGETVCVWGGGGGVEGDFGGKESNVFEYNTNFILVIICYYALS